MKNKFIKDIKDIFDVTAGGTASIVGSVVSETVVGQVLPGVTTAVLAYRQKRTERNMERFFNEIKLREDEFNNRLADLEEKKLFDFKDKYFGLITDYVIDEVQEDKIKYIVNGLVNLASYESIQEDFVLTYYDTLRNLRLADIVVLKFYYNLSYNFKGQNYQTVLDETGLDYEQYLAIREKLIRVKLIETRRDNEIGKLFDNVIEIEKFLTGKNKQKLSLKSLSSFLDNINISKYGANFLKFFVNEQTNTEEV